MNRFFRLIAILFLSGYLLTQLLSLGLSGRTPGNFFERMMVAVTGPVQSMVDQVFTWCGDTATHYLLLVDVSRQNEQLRMERDRLKTVVLKLKEQASENERLRALVGLGQTQQLKLLGAERIASGASPRERITRISRGTRHGVQQGMAVIHPQGVVGQVFQVYGHYSDILLLADAASAIDVVSVRSRAHGILRGVDLRTLRFEYLSKDADMQVGDVLMSSGLDGVYPPNIPVGTVTRVAKGRNPLFLSAEVKPSVDLARLEEVAIVLAPKNVASK